MNAEACGRYAEANSCMMIASRHPSKEFFSDLAFNNAGCKADDVGTLAVRGRIVPIEEHPTNVAKEGFEEIAIASIVLLGAIRLAFCVTNVLEHVFEGLVLVL
ncbi:hypothetical protein IG631_13190 [Alternaria alternata]|nr:hypothetical protein IG631_13190 [Alternaria alternata]